MKNLLKIASIIGLTVITQTAYSGEVTATFTTGDILTAEKLKNIKSAVNDNDTRISNIALTPGPAGAASTVAGPKGDTGAVSTVVGPQGSNGADGSNGSDGADGSNGSNGADGTPCTVSQGQGSATITCGFDMVSVYGITTGGEAGDMQYHDGTEWVLVKSPTDTTVVNTLSIVNGKPSWAPTYYEIGDRGPAGGFVFYVKDDGLHGLEVYPNVSGLDHVAWGCDGLNISGASGTAVGSGPMNTAAILSSECGSSPAASRVSQTSLNGIDDWYLPSTGELLKLSQVDGVLRGQWGMEGCYNCIYWSSSTANNIRDAYAMVFGGATNLPHGALIYGLKVADYLVRAIRTF
jgi:hypothetical protein